MAAAGAHASSRPVPCLGAAARDAAKPCDNPRLDYSARLEIAKHGFESVTLRLARDYDRYKSIAERHGIQISARRVRHVLDQVEREREKQSAWRRVLEQTTAALLRQQPGSEGGESSSDSAEPSSETAESD